MAEMKDFVEIGVDNYLTPEQIDFIKENPRGLTKEGVLQEIKNWENSNNRVQLYMYKRMLDYAKSLKQSGFTKGGNIILSIKNGKATWTKKPDTKI